MKLKISFFVVLLMGCLYAMAQQPKADFSATNAQGDTLYYNILDSTARTVAVTNVLGGLEIDTLPHYHDMMNPDSVYYVDTVLYEGDVVIPDSVQHDGISYCVTTIGTYAFSYCRELASITLPNTITKIEKHAFEHCDSLREFTIPQSVTTMIDTAFRNNPNLKTLHWNARKIAHYGRWEDWYNTFYPPFVNTPFETVVFGAGVREIPDFAVSDINTIDSISIANSVSKIGEFAFFDCHRVKHLELPNSLITILDYAFRQCKGLEEMVIPNSVVDMHEYIFADCSSLKRVTLPNTMQKIPNGTFYHCDSLARFEIPHSVTIIGGSAFRACWLLDSIEIPNSVREIQIDAFAGCRSLTEITIPASVNDMGNAFDYCPKLKTVYWNAPSFDDNMFGSYDAWEGKILYPFNGSAVEKVVFGDSVTMIPHYAFQDCESLDSLIIKGEVANIDHNAFSGCWALSYMRIESLIPPILASTAFNYVDSSIAIEVSCKALDTFIVDPHWTRFNQIQAYNTCYQITATSNNETWGTVTGSDTYPSGSLATLEAIAMANFEFVAWNDGDTNNPRMVTVSQDSAFIANFAYITYDVNVESDNEAWGYVEGDSTYNYGSLATIKAIPNEGYKFLEWSDGNTSNPRVVFVTQDTLFRAMFTIRQYQITTQSNYPQRGSVTEGGIYNHGDTITIEATPTYGYYFASWDDGNTENPRTIAVTHDSTFTANFATLGYHVNLASNNDTWGNVEGDSTYNYGSLASIKAVANEGYKFQQWSDGNTTNPRVIIVTRDTNFTAIFAAKQHLIITMTNNALWGSVEGGGIHHYGDTIALEATATNGYHFVAWNDGNTENPRTIVVSRDSIFIANFEISQYHINVSSNNDAWGTTTGSNTYLKDSIATIKAIAAEHYHFERWDDNNIENPREILVSQDSNFVALFAIDQHQITVASNNSSWGNVTGNGSYDYGETVTLEAIANEGYHFETWNDGDTINPRTVVVTSDTVLVANFAKDVPVGIDHHQPTIDLNIYPNPTTGIVHIASDAVLKIEVYNIIGVRMAQFEGEATIDLSALEAGQYNLKIETAEGIVIRKIIKR